jgi:pimeloyl-ACP methyl ester carboxylesterase
MAQVKANGISIEYESFGPESADPVLLIMGLGAQLTLWPVELCEALVSRGFRVVRYDNRDVGLSTKFVDAPVPQLPAVLAAVMSGQDPKVPYRLDDMAADAAGLLDALGLERAHIVGASMGGMIAQLFAATYPARTLSLTSIMSTTGNPAVPPASPEAIGVLMSRPQGGDVDAVVEFGVKAARVIGSPAYPADETALRARVRRDVERSNYPAGFARQMAAIYANGDRRAKLASITAPTVVIHGAADPLVPIEGGRDTAASIKGAELIEIEGMGHDLPLALVDRIADAVAAVAKRAKVAA